MKFYSTKSPGQLVDLRTAVLQSLPSDGGLYMPQEVPRLQQGLLDNLDRATFPEIATAIATPYLSEDLSNGEIISLITAAIDFPAPLIQLDDQLSILELWHGPSLAFKDFGARFMAALMSRLVAGDGRKLTILVATSGDTGGAVASGFYGVENVEVVILYPSGKVSPLQEKQLTTLGRNIKAIEVAGTFDDCQALVKQAFLDREVNERNWLSSANSINISRLLPQTFYYFEAIRQLKKSRQANVAFVVPSGNFGNLTAGVLAYQMGLPVAQFIAATNVNDIVPAYIKSGLYQPRPSQSTISNAMDVGAPSNFQRLQHLFGDSWEALRTMMAGYAFSDEETRSEILRIRDRYNYVIDPHGAVGTLAAVADGALRDGLDYIVLETAHPAKFLPVMEPLIGEVDIPERLAELASKKKEAVQLSTDFEAFKGWLMER